MNEGEFGMKSRLGKAAMWSALVLAIALITPIAAPVAAQNRGATRPKVDRPDGPVWQVIRKNCTSCHGIDDYAFYALDRSAWQSLIETKHKDKPVNVLVDTDRDLLLDWLVSKFGPTSTAFPRTYIAPEITEFFSDPEANRLLERACSRCHSLDRVNLARKSADEWRVLTIQMKTKGAELSDEEVEKLVEWLARVKGINSQQ